MTVLFGVHVFAALLVFGWSLQDRLHASASHRWALVGIVLGVAAIGVFAWETRDDWRLSNKLTGVVLTGLSELLVLSVVLRLAG